ncbi:MAG: hypothetical protein ACK518_01780 [bacterium]
MEQFVRPPNSAQRREGKDIYAQQEKYKEGRERKMKNDKVPP